METKQPFEELMDEFGMGADDIAEEIVNQKLDGVTIGRPPLTNKEAALAGAFRYRPVVNPAIYEFPLVPGSLDRVQSMIGFESLFRARYLVLWGFDATTKITRLRMANCDQFVVGGISARVFGTIKEPSAAIREYLELSAAPQGHILQLAMPTMETGNTAMLEYSGPLTQAVLFGSAIAS